MMNVLVAALGLSFAGAFSSAGWAASPDPGTELRSSTSATVGSIYSADRMRDPFARRSASKGSFRAFKMEDFSIHKLSLRGIMKDSGSEFALLVDNESDVSFLLRKGRLYDAKNKPIPGIGGTMNLRQKMGT
ncbi:MAG: hypothetical protein WC881_08920, partial [Elusimicrobiota bacterium]